jgi:hypothetical protein
MRKPPKFAAYPRGPAEKPELSLRQKQILRIPTACKAMFVTNLATALTLAFVLAVLVAGVTGGMITALLIMVIGHVTVALLTLRAILLAEATLHIPWQSVLACTVTMVVPCGGILALAYLQSWLREFLTDFNIGVGFRPDEADVKRALSKFDEAT